MYGLLLGHDPEPLSGGPAEQAGRFRCPHPLKELGVVKLYAKRAIHMGVFIVLIRCEPVGTTVVLSPEQRVVRRGFGETWLWGRKQHQTASHEREKEPRQVLDHRRLRSRWRYQGLEISSSVGDQ